MKFNKKNIYITLFGILYGGVALVSLIHAVSFFALANLLWLAILLAIIFEIGQSAVLFSILTSSTGKSKTMPWVLMCILTAVQILGNVFSSYKYIVSNSPENLRFFKEPVFIWTDIPDAQATVIITYIVGGILPLVALAMSAMVTNYLEDENNKNFEQTLIDKENLEKLNKVIEEAPEAKLIPEENGKQEEKSGNDSEQQPMDASEDKGNTEDSDKKDEEIATLKKQLKDYEDNPLINEHSILQMENQGLQESNQKKDEEIENLKKQLEDLKHPKIQQIPSTEIHEPIQFSEPGGLKNIKEENKENLGDPIGEEGEQAEKYLTDEEIKQAEDLIKNGLNNQDSKQSHFINI